MVTPRAVRLAAGLSIVPTGHFQPWYYYTSDIYLYIKSMILSIKGTLYMYLLLVYLKTFYL